MSYRYATTLLWLLLATSVVHAQNANFMNGTGNWIDAILKSSVPVKVFSLAFAGCFIYACWERSQRAVVALIVICLCAGGWALSDEIIKGVMGRS